MDSAYEINDKRSQSDLRGITFSGFKKCEVKKQLIGSLSANKIENALFWSAEYICAGHFLELWEIIILFVSKQIYNANPKLPIYCEMKFNNFKEIMSAGYVGSELKLRNNQSVRNLFAEIITLICCSKKKSPFQDCKIPKDSFQITELKHYLVADSLTYAEYFRKEDPKELILACNELSYNLRSTVANSQMCYYWIEWLLDYISYCSKKKEPLKIDRRSFVVDKVDPKLQKDPVWLLWDAMFLEASKRKERDIMLRIMKSLLRLFCIHYTEGCKKRRKYLLYFCVVLCTETTNYATKIIDNKEFIKNIATKINLVYKENKKNEIKPDTDYLFNNMKQTSLEKTIEKLEMMSNASFFPRM